MRTPNLRALARDTGRTVLIPLLGMLAGLGAAIGVTAAMTPSFEATSSVIVLPAPVGDSEAVRLADVTLAQSLVSSIASLADSVDVTTDASQQLGIPADVISGHISGTSTSGSQIVKVHATASSGARAAAIADAAAEGIVNVVKGLRLGGSAIVVQRLDRAAVPASQASPRTLLNYTLGALIGLLLGAAGVTLLTRTADHLESVEDIEAALDLPALGVIRQRTPRRPRDARSVYGKPRFSQPVNGLVSALAVLAGRSGGRRIVLAAVRDDNSAAFVGAVLAVGIEHLEGGATVLEAHLPRPVLGKHFGTDSCRDVEKALARDPQYPDPTGPAVLTSGTLAEYFDHEPSSAQLGALINSLADRGNDVIVVAPSVLGGRGLTRLAEFADLLVLVLDSDQVRRADALRAAQLTKRLGVPLVGLVAMGSAADHDGGEAGSWSSLPTGGAQTIPRPDAPPSMPSPTAPPTTGPPTTRATPSAWPGPAPGGP